MWDWKTSSGGDNDGVIVDLTPSGTLRLMPAEHRSGRLGVLGRVLDP